MMSLLNQNEKVCKLGYKYIALCADELVIYDFQSYFILLE